MKNIISDDVSIKEAAEWISRGSYPEVAKTVANQLLIACAENEQLRTALKPFGELSDNEVRAIMAENNDLTFDDFRVAAEVLKESE